MVDENLMTNTQVSPPVENAIREKATVMPNIGNE